MAPFALALACSPSPSGSSNPSVNWSISGHTLNVTDGLAVTDPKSAIPYVFVVLGDRANLCPLLQGAGTTAAATGQVANLTSLELQLFDTRTMAFNTGTFPVPPSNPTSTPVVEADVLFSTNGSGNPDGGDGCGSQTVYEWATSGTVTVTALTPTVVGSYDLMFGSSHVTGDFNVNNCANVNIQGTGDGMGGGTPPVCEH